MDDHRKKLRCQFFPMAAQRKTMSIHFLSLASQCKTMGLQFLKMDGQRKKLSGHRNETGSAGKKSRAHNNQIQRGGRKVLLHCAYFFIMKNNFAKYLARCLLCSLLLTAQIVAASEPEYEVDEYKAPSGGWKIVHKMDRKSNNYKNDLIKAVSPAEKETLIDKWVHLSSVTWLNGDTAEIVNTCGVPCKFTYFFDISKGTSGKFFNIIAYSIKDNLIAYPSCNKKKKRDEITVSEIYTNKKTPVAVVYRKWQKSPAHSVIENAKISNDTLSVEYIDDESEEIKKEDIFLEKEPPFVVCDDKSSEGEIEYCSIAEDNYKKGYILFAAEKPPVGMIDTPKESPLCYRFPSFGLDGQLQKLKDKYGAALYDEKITKEPDGSSYLSAKRKDESGKEIVYTYFDNPMSCAEYQTKRLGEAPPVPYYDYGGCVGECCGYHKWTANEKVFLRKDHNDSSSIVATVEKNEEVNSLTGIVVTTQPGKIEVLKNIDLNKNIDCGVSFEKGNNIYTLHYLGEGYSLIWHNGQLYDCAVMIEEKEYIKYFTKINREISEWWAKVSTKDGREGWTNEIEKFKNVYCNE